VTLNTAGGITGGDRFDLSLSAQADTTLTLTTQAAERAYRAAAGTGRIQNVAHVASGARLNWLPQETILFEGSRLTRRLDVTLEDTARCLLVESVIFGRTAMGEVLHDVVLSDHITLHRAGRVVFADRTHLSGDAHAHLSRSATGQGAAAMASLVFTAPGAGDLLDAARACLTGTAGISQPAPDLLFARLLAPDGFALRASLIPLIALFHPDPLPRPWMI
jgi:urease accessory protein